MSFKNILMLPSCFITKLFRIFVESIKWVIIHPIVKSCGCSSSSDISMLAWGGDYWTNFLHSTKFTIFQQSGNTGYLLNMTWWRHPMETFSAWLALCEGNSPVPVNSPHKGQWRGALMFSLICARINNWVNNCETGDLRRHRGHYDVIVMKLRGVSTAKLWWHLTNMTVIQRT